MAISFYFSVINKLFDSWIDTNQERLCLPFTPRCPFIRLPTDGDTRPRDLSERIDSLFSGTTIGSTASTGSAHTVSIILSMLVDLGSRLFTTSLLQNMNNWSNTYVYIYIYNIYLINIKCIACDKKYLEIANYLMDCK